MKETLIKLISSYGTWQTDNDDRKGTWIDEEDIESIAEAIITMLNQNNQKNELVIPVTVGVRCRLQRTNLST